MKNKGLIILLVFLVILLLFTLILYLQNQKPQVKPGVVNGQFYELNDRPNGVSTQTSYEDKKIAVLPFKGTLEETKSKFLSAMKAYKGIEIIREEENYIYAVATTETMKFHDDIEVYFDTETQEIHYRSSSRAGYSDGGLNKQRYEAIAEKYKEQQ